MPSTNIPGTCAYHGIITDECRRNRGNVGALAEAYRRMLEQYRQFISEKNGLGIGLTFHVVLTVERPNG